MSTPKDLALWILDLQAKEADQMATLKETRQEIKDATQQLVAAVADQKRPLLPQEDDE